MKNVAVLTEHGAFALLFRPNPGRFDSSKVPTSGNLPSKAKKMLMSGVQPGEGAGGWAQVELTDAFCVRLIKKTTELPHLCVEFFKTFTSLLLQCLEVS